VGTFANWLCSTELDDRYRFAWAHDALSANPTKAEIRQVFEDGTPWNKRDAAVVFVTGHGLHEDGSHWLLLRQTDIRQLARTALKTSELVAWLKETDIQHLMIIFDLCYAGAIEVDTIRFDKPLPRNWIVLAATARNTPARTGALTECVRDFLDELASDIGERFHHGPYLKIGDFIGEIQDRLRRHHGQDLTPLNPPQLSQTSVCLPHPRHLPQAESPVAVQRRDLALRPEDLDAHWGPRSRGVAASAETSWLFSGRAELMTQLIDAATGQPGAVVVTGGAGSGKSAALSRLVTLSDPAFTEAHAEHVDPIPDKLRPPLGAVDVAVLATGKVPHEILGQICDALRVEVPSSGSAPSVRTLREAWWAKLSNQTEPVTIVVDAVDESAYPRSLIDDVLAQLEPPDRADRKVRLIVGIRSTSSPNATGSAADLAEVAERTVRAQRLRVDQAPLWNQDDLRDYALEILATTPGSPYARDDRALEIANTIAAKAGTSFLIARIAATSLARRTEPIDPTDRVWLAALDAGVVGVFRDDLHTSVRDSEERLRFLQLLRAVAFAYGLGLPWHQIWPRVADAVADEPAHRFGDNDIAALLNSRLAGYLVTDTEDDTTVYRLFHDALRTALREDWRSILDSPHVAV
jgi:hypothetical protein